MATILCYGDSNTWGFVPGKYDETTMYMERYARDVRWTGRLQQLLGEHYHVIEEGLNGRTTNLDYPDLLGRNGKSYLVPCLYSHAPLDLVIILLGGNDLKKIFQRSASDIAEGLEELIQLTQATLYGADMQSCPEILIVGYPHLTREDGFSQYGHRVLFEEGIAKSHAFDSLYRELADRYQCHYFNAAPHVHLSEIDGIHLDESGHKALAECLAIEINTIINK